MNTEQRYLLRITCPGRTGLVITGFLADQHCFITGSHSLMIFKPVAFFVAPNFLNLNLA